MLHRSRDEGKLLYPPFDSQWITFMRCIMPFIKPLSLYAIVSNLQFTQAIYIYMPSGNITHLYSMLNLSWPDANICCFSFVFLGLTLHFDCECDSNVMSVICFLGSQLHRKRKSYVHEGKYLDFLVDFETIYTK